MAVNRELRTGIGEALLPENIRRSQILQSSHKTLLGSIPEIPAINPAWYDERLKNIFQYYSINPDEMEKELQLYAKELLEAGKLNEAWQVLLSFTQ